MAFVTLPPPPSWIPFSLHDGDFGSHPGGDPIPPEKMEPQQKQKIKRLAQHAACLKPISLARCKTVFVYLPAALHLRQQRGAPARSLKSPSRWRSAKLTSHTCPLLWHRRQQRGAPARSLKSPSRRQGAKPSTHTYPLLHRRQQRGAPARSLKSRSRWRGAKPSSHTYPPLFHRRQQRV